MNLNLPTVGPIVGHTSHAQARLWLRGSAPQKGSQARTFCAVRWREKAAGNGHAWNKPIVNKMSPTFDFTAVAVAWGLKPATTYQYQAVWFLTEGEIEQARALFDAAPAPDWPDAMFELTTGTDDPAAPRSFVVGSCRYLLKIFGGTLYDDRGDKTFDSIAEQHARAPLHGVVMVGDQIYADDLLFLAPDRRIDEFFARYRAAFSEPGIRGLMSRVPTYMILDDHEIEDNWPKRATPTDRTTLYPQAMHAYQSYQVSHSPVLSARADGRLQGTPLHYWYTFKDGCADWFVMDSRTERNLEHDPPQMVSEEQMGSLIEWLDDGHSRLKFIVSSVPVFPDLRRDSADKWGAFAADRRRILDAIRRRGRRDVIFVSGDVHSSFVGALQHSQDATFRVHTIVSSSFFWPYPHMRAKDFAFGTPLLGEGNTEYRPTLMSKVHGTDNFARLDVTPSAVRTAFYDRKGELLEEVIIRI